MSDETVDILCVITEHASLRDDFRLEQILARAYTDPRGLIRPSPTPSPCATDGSGSRMGMFSSADAISALP